MPFKLSSRSLKRLQGVNPLLVRCVHDAIGVHSSVDFGVTEGLRNLERQKQLVAQKRSQTLKSKHIDGNAVDLVAYIDGEVVWSIGVYDDIADAMKASAKAIGLSIKWGAAWHKNLTDHDGTCEDLMNEYIDLRRSQGRRPFIDGPHFEVAT